MQKEIVSTKQTFHYTNKFSLESDEYLPEFELQYQTWGTIRYDDSGKPNNVVWVCHALTANADVMDWWEGLFGENKVFDPNEYFIICANVLGSCYGSSNALSKNPEKNDSYFHDFPLLTIRDMVNALELLRKELNISKINYCLGGSMGGQQVLEWAIMQPKLFDKLFVIASNAKHSPWGIAFNESQRMAIENDVTWQSKSAQAGLQGMKTARAMALLSYRNYVTYDMTQAEDNEEIQDSFKASSYQKYQGEKLAKRFHAFSYWYLSKAMDSHNVGRGRGSLEKALAQIQAKVLVVAIKTDILFPLPEQQFLASHIPNAEYHEINSVYGHDGFLIETEAIKDIILKTFN